MDLLADDFLLDLRPRARRPAAAPTPVQAPVPAVKPVEGPCALCGTRPARTACASCGRGVCSIDLWSMLGLCKSCVAPEGAAR